MKIISHRGYWKEPKEKNSLEAFHRSFSRGYGTETDFRDYCQKIVISHDIADNQSIDASTFFQSYISHNCDGPLALNIKSDGLQILIKSLVDRFGIKQYFTFDMSVPDTLGYLKAEIVFFSRQSEYEPVPAFYNECAGIWLDSFINDWYDAKLINAHINKDKQVAIVSPELHKRDYQMLWNKLKNNEFHLNENVILCTDFPEVAKTFFFDEKNE